MLGQSKPLMITAKTSENTFIGKMTFHYIFTGQQIFLLEAGMVIFRIQSASN